MGLVAQMPKSAWKPTGWPWLVRAKKPSRSSAMARCGCGMRALINSHLASEYLESYKREVQNAIPVRLAHTRIGLPSAK